MIKAVKLVDTGDYLITFPNGSFVVNHGGEKMFVSAPYGGKEVSAAGFDEICSVKTNVVTSHFEDAKGNKLDAEEYADRKAELTKNGTPEDYGAYHFEDLDEEFAYKKFFRRWKEIRRESVTYSDPLPVEITEVVIDTGNKYITPAFCLNGDPAVYIYNRNAAVFGIITEIFSEVGMTFEGKVGYEATNNKKIWGNSDHSGIRYVTAFNTYPFSESWDFSRNPTWRGPLKDCKAMYESHRKELRRIILARFKTHFGLIDDDKLKMMARGIIGELKSVQSSVASIDYKAKSRVNAWAAQKRIRELIEKTERTLADA